MTASEGERSAPAKETDPFTRRVKIAVSFAAGAVVLGLLVWKLAGVLLLLFAAVLFGTGLHAAAVHFERRLGVPRLVGVAAITLLFVATAVAFVWFAGASLSEQFQGLADRLARAMDVVQAWMLEQPLLGAMGREVESIRSGSGSNFGLVGRVTDVSRLTVGTLSAALVVTVLAVYLGFDGRRYIAGVIRLVPQRRRDTARELIHAWGEALAWWLVGRILSMTVVGVLTWIGLMIVGVPVSGVLAVLTGLLSFVPFLGPIVSAIPAALVAFTVSSRTVIWVVVVFSGVQLLENYLITPQIQERTVSVPAVVLMSAQLVVGSLLGLAGIMFATPLVVATAVAVQLIYVRGILGEEVELWGAHES